MENFVAPGELIGRFIYSSGHFSPEASRIKCNAFMPSPANETSVFRIDDLLEDAVWAIGRDIGAERKQTLHARGDITASDIRQVGLEVESAEPPTHHAIIVRWPSEKSEQKLHAMVLAEKAKLVLPIS